MVYIPSDQDGKPLVTRGVGSNVVLKDSSGADLDLLKARVVDANGQDVAPKGLLSTEERSKLVPVLDTITLTSANTEYSKVLPRGTVKYELRLRDGATFRLAFATGFVATPTAPYITVPAGHLWEDFCSSDDITTLYVADPVGTKVAEVIYWGP